MPLTTQKRIAASILKCGASRVWIDPNRLEDVELAITRDDVRRLITEGAIKELPKVGLARHHKARRGGPGRRKRGLGKKKRHELRVQKVRALRGLLKELRDSESIEKGAYRRLYLMVKGGMFASKKELLRYIDAQGLRVQ